MKTFYDLTRKERKEYKKEFKTTPVGKEIHSVYFYLCALAFWFLFILAGIQGVIDREKIVNEGLQQFCYGMGIFIIILVVIVNLWRFYENICFSSWLKYKHKINRW